MREIPTHLITNAVSDMCLEANCLMAPDIRAALETAERQETNPLSREVLVTLRQNATIARDMMIPLCQDTGMAVIFAEVGQEARVIGGDLTEALNSGIAMGYEKGYLRKSVVSDPIERQNTQNNTPAVIHYKIVPGDQLKLILAPKGFGSENMSAIKMLNPSQGLTGVKDFVVQTVTTAGPNPCPPLIVGVGVGGTMEKAALLAKESLLRPVGHPNLNPFWQEVEQDLLTTVNALNIGPAGFGGRTTALAVHISPWATHIAGLPVAVNLGCHSTRHAQRII